MIAPGADEHDHVREDAGAFFALNMCSNGIAAARLLPLMFLFCRLGGVESASLRLAGHTAEASSKTFFEDGKKFANGTEPRCTALHLRGSLADRTA